MSKNATHLINSEKKTKILAEKGRNENKALSGQDAFNQGSSSLHVKAEKMKLLDKVQLDGENEIAKSSELSESFRPVKHSTPSKIPKVTRKAKKKFKVFDPSYTWNKGGRIKELRLRYLARKYLHLWLIGTFGSIKISKARLLHFEEKIKKKCMNQIKNIWWHNRKEYRLNLRADLHNKYRLYNIAWKSWTTFMKIQSVENEKNLIADNYRNFVLKKKAIQIWVKYIGKRRLRNIEKEKCRPLYNALYLKQNFGFEQQFLSIKMLQYMEVIVLRQKKKDLQKKASEYHELKTKRTYLCAWKLFMKIKKNQEYRNELSQNLRKKSLLKFAWQMWLKRCDQRDEIIQYNQIKTAQTHYSKQLLKKSLLKLVNYVNHRRHKRSLNATADLQFSSKILPKMFNNLKTYTEFRRYKRELLEDSLQFRTESLYSMVFYHWKDRLERNREHRLNTRIALLHREKLILKQTFELWRMKAERALMVQTQMEIADEHYFHNIMKKYLSYWMMYTNAKNDKRIKEIFSQNFYCIKLLKISFNTLRSYKNYQKQKKAKIERADKFFHTKLFKQVFHCLKINVHNSSIFNEKAEKFSKRYSTKLLCSSFTTWREMVTIWKSEKNYMQIAEIYFNAKLAGNVIKEWRSYTVRRIEKTRDQSDIINDCRERLRSSCLQYYFTLWKSKRDIVLMNRLDNERASLRFAYSIKVKVFRSWVAYIKNNQKTSIMKQQAQNYYSQKLKKTSWLTWQNSLIAKEKQNSQTAIALWHWSMKLQWKSMEIWKRYIEKRKYKKEMYKLALDEYRNRLLKSAVSDWIKTADQLQNLKRKMALSRNETESQREFSLALKVISHWKFWASKKSLSRSEKPSCQLSSSVEKSQPKVKLKVQFADPISSDSLPIVKAREKPRKPDFLVDSLNSDGLITSISGEKPDDQEFKRHVNEVTSSPKETNKPSLKSFEKVKLQSPREFSEEKDPKPKKISLLPPTAFMSENKEERNSLSLEEEMFKIKSFLRNYKQLKQKVAKNEDILKQLMDLKGSDNDNLSTEISKEIEMIFSEIARDRETIISKKEEAELLAKRGQELVNFKRTKPNQ
ncbi:DgyrCDS8523 [Dimorphilus gyrociliatus]|uniref:DgyrCDS8523 n=1 Tax=Dimorphilus gyrociliatus TaxID=2664684 RepID=A0A7I8VUF8_9ANNE|nr:DgyrCDS8523 [Dimorphilus gyrociliatus]